MIKKIIGSLIRKNTQKIYTILYRSFYVHGDASRLSFGDRVNPNNTIFNTASGDIKVGSDTIFGFNCMFLTGTHEYIDGKRKHLVLGKDEVPESGRDIIVGSECFIASGVIIIGPVKIGDSVIIGAGSVVTKDIPSNVMVAGNPAKIVKTNQ